MTDKHCAAGPDRDKKYNGCIKSVIASTKYLGRINDARYRRALRTDAHKRNINHYDCLITLLLVNIDMSK